MNETQKKIKQDGQDLQHKRNKNICVYLCSSAVKFLCVLSYLNGFILLLSFGIFAQNNDDVIRIETDLIPFEVTVTDKNGKPVRGLDVKDFKLFEDGAERPIDFFEPIKRNDDSRPLSIVFALDVSGSIAPEELVKLRSALESFVKRLADYDSYFAVMTFGMQVKTLQSFTNRPDKLEKTFEKLLREQDGLKQAVCLKKRADALSMQRKKVLNRSLNLWRKKSPLLMFWRFIQRRKIVRARLFAAFVLKFRQAFKLNKIGQATK
ncbi:MAG: VWA domain-containing protein [Acidobacteria bacterium]|nr:VWA domain-containing protein [Acidobacteriota bacterium]